MSLPRMICSVCNASFERGNYLDFNAHDCSIEFHSEYWAEKFSHMSEDEMDGYEYLMEMQDRYGSQY